MAIGKYSLMFVLMILIGIVYKTTAISCPPYPKHLAIREGILSGRAICRAKNLPYNHYICLNGEYSDWAYCSTGSCNIFGYNCDGHCLSGDDFIHEETDFTSECDISYEIKNLCDFYLKYEPSTVFYTPKLEKLCPHLKSLCKKSISKNWKYQ